VDAHAEEAGHQDRRAREPEADRADAHDPDLEQLHGADDPRLLDLVGELTGRRREEEEREDEDAAREVHEHGRIERRLRDAEREQDDQRVLEDVVVERAEELGPEEGREPTGAQELPLGHAARLLCAPARDARAKDVVVPAHRHDRAPDYSLPSYLKDTFTFAR
jgi:hypothetical protein